MAAQRPSPAGWFKEPAACRMMGGRPPASPATSAAAGVTGNVPRPASPVIGRAQRYWAIGLQASGVEPGAPSVPPPAVADQVLDQVHHRPGRRVGRRCLRRGGPRPSRAPGHRPGGRTAPGHPAAPARVEATVPLHGGPVAVASGASAVWVTSASPRGDTANLLWRWTRRPTRSPGPPTSDPPPPGEFPTASPPATGRSGQPEQTSSRCCASSRARRPSTPGTGLGR